MNTSKYKMMFLISILINFIYLIKSLPQRPMTTISDGALEGIYSETINNRTYSAFTSIPYAAPPVGANRFLECNKWDTGSQSGFRNISDIMNDNCDHEPQPVEPWQGVLDAGIPSLSCLQLNIEKMFVLGEEDCLLLNVYTPKLDFENDTQNYTFPVIVYIHGGAFMELEASGYGPAYLLDTMDLVLVTINYRLGPLGFLSTEDDVVPGNNGLKDQVQALQWIQKFIEVFGGDKNSVTLTGMSAGSASVHFMYLSDKSNGLFHRGFGMSGATLCPWTIAKDLLNKTIKIATMFKCSTENSQAIVECLRIINGSDIVRSSSIFMYFQYNPFTPWGPTVEVPNPHAFLVEDPYTLLKKGKLKNLPLILSDTAQEGLFPDAAFVANDTILAQVNQDWLSIAPQLLDYNYTVKDILKDPTSKKIRLFYLGTEDISPKTVPNIVKLTGERLFIADVVRTAMLQASRSSANIYYYVFSYRGKYSLSDQLSGTDINLGVSHGDDTAYIFNTTYLDSQTTPLDREMSKEMVHMLGTFATTGSPRLGFAPYAIWEPVSKSAEETKIINFLEIAGPRKYQMKSSFNFGNWIFWQSLPINEPWDGRFSIN